MINDHSFSSTPDTLARSPYPHISRIKTWRVNVNITDKAYKYKIRSGTIKHIYTSGFMCNISLCCYVLCENVCVCCVHMFNIVRAVALCVSVQQTTGLIGLRRSTVD